MIDMENKIILSALFAFLSAVASSVMADPSATETKAPEKVAKPVKEKAAEEVRKNYEPAARFTPTEKLRADDTVTFPVDI